MPDSPADATSIRASLLLADHAQVADGKLFVSGGGWAMMGGVPAAHAVVAVVHVPPEQVDAEHVLALHLYDVDGPPVLVQGPDGSELAPFEQVTRFSPTIEPLLDGVPLSLPLAVNFGPLPIPPGRYAWQLTVDGHSDPAWRVTFGVLA